MMTSAHFFSCVTCLLLGIMAQIHLTSSGSVHQEGGFISAHVGDSVTLRCFHSDMKFLYWYMQPLGDKPTVISIFYKHATQITFYEKFKNNSRFTLDTENGKHHLTISDLRLSDSATYYCAFQSPLVVNFAEGTTVSVKDSDLNIQTLIHQLSDPIQPGDSVSLNCTVQTGGCDGEHRVYWFKDNEESHPGLIYTHGGRNDQCERNPNTESHTCVFNLLMKDLTVSHAGTYYCAVASCGHMLFGKGTKLDLTHEVNFVSYFWTGVLAFTSILCVLLAFSVCLMNKSDANKSSVESKPGSSRLPTDAKVCPRAENIYCAVASGALTDRSRGQKDPTWSECVYYTVKL